MNIKSTNVEVFCYCSYLSMPWTVAEMPRFWGRLCPSFYVACPYVFVLQCFISIALKHVSNFPTYCQRYCLKTFLCPLHLSNCFWFGEGTRWRSWLRHCFTSRRVAGSIPDGVIGIFH